MARLGTEPSQVVVIRLLDDHPNGLAPAKLIDGIVREGYDANSAARTIRSMLNSGDIGLDPEMQVRLIKQLA